MKRRHVLLLLAAVAVAFAGMTPAHAEPPFLDLFNSTFGTASTPLNTCFLCHPSGVGPNTNAFGAAFNLAGFNFSPIVLDDSDGDGFSNIAEINARTFPGNAANVPSSAAIPTPVSGRTVIAFPAPVAPVLNPDPAKARPLGFGAIATGGGTITVQVGLNAATTAVDVYLVILAPAVSSDLFVLTPTGIRRTTTAGIVPWTTTAGPISTTLFADVPASALPPGTYTLFFAATPTQSTSTFYLWQTGFTIVR